jgi:hypothetical protein
MRFIFLTLMLFLFSQVPASALAEEAAAPILRADPTEVDFGEAAQHQVREAKVKLTNPGAQPVVVFSVKTDCRCTTASLSKMTIASGEDATLTVRLETRAESGNVHRMVIVHASSGHLAVSVKVAIVPSSPP